MARVRQGADFHFLAVHAKGDRVGRTQCIEGDAPRGVKAFFEVCALLVVELVPEIHANPFERGLLLLGLS